LHERRIVFRDLKPDNVVRDAEQHCLLTDFGLSKEEVERAHGGKSVCGSTAFLAPEILTRREHGHVVDIYGLGVLIFDMLTGMPPFFSKDPETLKINICHANLQMPSFMSVTAQSVVHALMKRDPSQRLGAEQTSDVRKHEFFTPIDFMKLLCREVPVPQSRGSKTPRRASDDSPVRPGNSPFAAAGGHAAVVDMCRRLMVGRNQDTAYAQNSVPEWLDFSAPWPTSEVSPTVPSLPRFDNQSSLERPGNS